jgi:nitrite reductase (NADH) large subunit
LPGTPWLVLGSAAAIIAILALALMPPVTFSSTLAEGSSLERFWREPTARQFTGYVALGLMLSSMLFSLRKRVPRFATDKLTSWRALHACLGAVTLAALATHTGIRMGQNFNRILMLNVLVLAIAGSLAGLVTALETRSTSPIARRLRAIWTQTHMFLSWPLPVLILVHVLTAYYF